MNPYKGYKAEKATTRELLPIGGYIAKILDAKSETYTSRDGGEYSKLIISFDIADGQFKDFFRRDYQNQAGEDKKWRGIIRLNIPQDDGSERDGWSKRTFNNAIWAVENSNTGYSWDWNEAGLKNKLVGVLYRNREWEMDGRTGWTTECCGLIDVQSIKDGKFKMPKDKPLPETQKTGTTTYSAPAEVDDADLPF